MLKTHSLMLFMLFVVLHVLASVSTAALLRGKIVGIVDGDTVTILLPDGAQRLVRLRGIDAPEKEQAFGTKARMFLSDILANKAVVVEYEGFDLDGRVVGSIRFNNHDASLEMLQAGFAWYDKEHAQGLSEIDKTRYQTKEAEAKRATIGLWADNTAQAPWAFRDSYQLPVYRSNNAIIRGAVQFTGQVIEITSAGSIAVLKGDYSRLEICVNNLYVPAIGQPYADVARQHLGELLLKREVIVRFRGFYEDDACLIGDVYLDNVDVSLQMIRDGVAWCDRRNTYTEYYYLYDQAEQAARAERRGIWQDSSPVPPWIYRGQVEASTGGGLGYGYSPQREYSLSLGKEVHVRGYSRRDGIYVRSHTRSAPGRGGGRGRR